MQQLDTHVNACVDCATLVGEFKSVLGLMEGQKSIDPKPFAETRIMQAIESRLEKKQTSYSPVLVRILQPAFVSIGLIAAVAIGFVIGSDFADVNLQYSQNEEMTEAVRSDLNVPEFMTDDIFYFSE
jgi:hypothetical protein